MSRIKLLVMTVLLACLLLALPTLAESAAKVEVLGQSVPADTETLSLDNIPLGDAGALIVGLDQLKQVKSVSLVGSGLSLKDMTALRMAFPAIQFNWTLDIYKQTVSSEDTFVDLQKQKVEDFEEFKAFLNDFPNLTKVDMYNTFLKRDIIDQMAVNYPQIEFGWTIRIAEHRIRTDQTAFSTLHSRDSKKHTGEDFRQLKYCKNMLSLDIGHNNATDISFLTDMPQLKVLILADNNLEDISVLAKLPNLEYIELLKNKVTDITPLAGLTNLLDLNLCFNYIDNLMPLYGLKKLERLWLYNSNNWKEKDPVPKDEVAAVQAALPNCYIDSTSYSTLGGWRRHPRYYVIFNTFKRGEYIPWDDESVQPKYPQPFK